MEWLKFKGIPGEEEETWATRESQAGAGRKFLPLNFEGATTKKHTTEGTNYGKKVEKGKFLVESLDYKPGIADCSGS